MASSERYLKANTLTANSNHTGITRLAGLSVRENASTAAAAAINLRHGSSTGQILLVVELAADESGTIELNREIRTPSGVYLEVVSGTVQAIAYTTE